MHEKSKTEIKKAKIPMEKKVNSGKIKVWHARRCVASEKSRAEGVHLYRETRNKSLPGHGSAYRNNSILRKESPRLLIKVFNCQNEQIT